MDANDICLITPIEINKKITLEDGTVENRFYLDELFRCIDSWRKRAGYLKNINIYAFNIQNHSLSQKVLDKFNSYNVKIIECLPNITSIENGFLYEPLCGKLFEEGNFQETISIKIDMDIVVLKPIPEKIIQISYDKTIIGQYDKNSSQTQRKVDDGFLPFDTNFIITNKNSHFYNRYYSLCIDKKILESKEYLSLDENYRKYFLDEIVIDAIYKENKDIIYPIQNYQYGDGYPNIKNFSKEQIQNIIFLHRHIKTHEQYNINQEILYILKALKK